MAKTSGRTKVVIVGAGFGGLNALKTLGNKSCDVLIVDRNNYHGFWPMLYQVATGALDSASIAFPVRGIIHPYKNADFQLANVNGVDWDKKQVLIDNGAPIDYDYLILAAGSAQFYFGNDRLAETTFSMKDVDQAEGIRNHVIQAFEKAQVETDPEKRKQLMTVAIVGGGPTGVELAGGFQELFQNDFKKDYPNLDMSEARICLIEAMGNIMLPFSDPKLPRGEASDIQKAVKAELEKRGVEVMTNKGVVSVENNVVAFKDETTLAAGTVIWAAGVRGAMLGDKLGLELQRGMRVPVTEFLNLPDHPEVFVVGDMAYLDGYKWGDGTMAYPQVAQVAIQMAEQAAKNIMVLASGGNPSPFSYYDKGSMAIIGRNAAVVTAQKPMKIKIANRGKFFGWVMWLAVHVSFLFGWRNRMVSVFNWAWNWLRRERPTRVMTGQRDDKTEQLVSS
jgi:NADH:ubiquinone reductase (H+-translocating)